MSNTLLSALVLAAFGAAVVVTSIPQAADAAQARGAQRTAAKKQPARYAAVPRADTRGQGNGLTGLRDRTTINQSNGRINGREFLEQIQERNSSGSAN